MSGIILQYIIFQAIDIRWLGWVGCAHVLAFLAGLPNSMGIAITRYRLYEIDIVINRTLVHGSLTLLLALLYFGSTTLLQYLLSLLTGQRGTLAIVASTLTIATLFNPWETCARVYRPPLL